MSKSLENAVPFMSEDDLNENHEHYKNESLTKV